MTFDGYRTRAACSIPLVLSVIACSGDMSAPVANADRQVVRVKITPSDTQTVPLNRPVALAAELTNRLGAPVWGALISWTSSNESVIVLSGGAQSRQVTATPRTPGTAIVTVASGGQTARVVVVVREAGPPAVAVITSIPSIGLGARAQLTVMVKDVDGVVLSDQPLTYTSSDPEVISVSAAGMMTARAPGTVTLSVTTGSASGSLAVVVTAAARAFVWTVATGMMNLGTLPGFVASRAYAVSAAGHVAGAATSIGDSGSHAFVSGPDARTPMRDLGALTATGMSAALGVNSAGVVVGWATTDWGTRHAVLWSATGLIEDLGTLPGDQSSEARAINDSGQVVGSSQDAQGNSRSFIWTATTGMRVIALTSGGSAYAINQDGVVGGSSNGAPYLWSAASGLQLLQPIMGDFNSDAGGFVAAVNSAGDAVGTSIGCSEYYINECPATAQQPALWLGGGAALNLRFPSGIGDGFALVSGINDRGQIVGVGVSAHALFWPGSGPTRDLGTMPDRISSSATAINGAGVVVGWSSNP